MGIIIDLTTLLSLVSIRAFYNRYLHNRHDKGGISSA